MARKKEQAKPALTAAIYARYSSNAQNDASIEQQIAETALSRREFLAGLAAATGALAVGGCGVALLPMI